MQYTILYVTDDVYAIKKLHDIMPHTSCNEFTQTFPYYMQLDFQDLVLIHKTQTTVPIIHN